MDAALARLMNRLGAGVIDPFTDMLCAVWFLAALWPATVAVGVWALSSGRRQLLLRVLIAGVLFLLCNELLLKHGLGLFRLRPYLADPQIVPIGYRFTDSSFPSSHAASTAALATVLGHAHRRFAAIGVGLVALMDFARVHDGMHYPSDVLIGTLLGVAYAAVAIVCVERFAKSS